MSNAGRILQRLGIRFEQREYEADGADLSAENVAGKVELPLAQVGKTFVAQSVLTMTPQLESATVAHRRPVRRCSRWARRG